MPDNEKKKQYYKKWRSEHPGRNAELCKANYAKNREDRKDKSRERRKNNPAYTKVYNRKWNAENPEKARAIWNRMNIKRYSTPKGKLSKLFATRMRQTLHGAKAHRHWEEFVEYTVDQLKRHLEKKFKPGMTWENYGTVWEVDHKVPIAVFNYEKPEDLDFRLCWSLRNLQPLEKQINRSKQAKINKPFQPSLAIGI